MLFVMPISSKRFEPKHENLEPADMYSKLYFQRSYIPKVTHVDYTARIQTVNKTTNERFWLLISEFKKLTGYGIVINTSFNIRDEPIVCLSYEAFCCFLNTDIDYLTVNNYLFDEEELSYLKDSSSKNYTFFKD
jgi:carbamoyltransferase